MNRAHDLYCFYFGAQKGSDVPIVFLYHDQEVGDFLAKNIQDFLFERIIYDMVDIDYYQENNEAKSKEQLEDTLRTHSKYMKQVHIEIIRAVMQRTAELFDVLNLNGQVIAQVKGLLSEKEAQELINQYIAFEQAGQSFVYMGA
ncbi:MULTISPECIES: hypothetical protein [Myroides]|uniref:Uncharacterized protein n=1 Tax=Myroides albus TaxID=2562892 RepID=A0A6I3LK24_9FLAO|nr:MULTISPECIES: hypothetical protein [Myroides]MTG98643.1 hypothetical protein [Myroides albus]MVX34632.1 hypothetical protein [Myroides sp. LoEW2-1]UVD79206.1 hypothetical protein NWE55_13895 [Myroides albus]